MNHDEIMTTFDVARRWGDERADGKANTRAVAKAMRQYYASGGAAGLRYFVRPCTKKESRKPHNWLTRLEWVMAYEESQQTAKPKQVTKSKPKRGRIELPGNGLTLEQVREQVRAIKGRATAA